MKIKTITYRTNACLGGYRTKHLEATAELAPGENPKKALVKLASWVHEQLGLKADTSKFSAPLRQLGDE